MLISWIKRPRWRKIAWTFFVLALCFFAWAGTLTRSYRQCATEHQRTYSKNKTNSDKDHIVTLLLCEGATIDANNALISAIAAVFVAWFTGTLWWAATGQYNLLDRQITLAKDLERPYVFIYNVRFISAHGWDTNSQIFYNVFNSGKMAAVIENVSIRCNIEKYQKFPPIVIIGDHELIRDSIISAGERRQIAHNIPAEHTRYDPPIFVLKDQLIFQVIISYHGPFTKEHETAKCWRFIHQPFGNGFVEVDDPRYTYMR